jgi:hypothetical protein
MKERNFTRFSKWYMEEKLDTLVGPSYDYHVQNLTGLNSEMKN